MALAATVFLVDERSIDGGNARARWRRVSVSIALSFAILGLVSPRGMEIGSIELQRSSSRGEAVPWNRLCRDLGRAAGPWMDRTRVFYCFTGYRAVCERVLGRAIHRTRVQDRQKNTTADDGAADSYGDMFSHDTF